MLKLCTWLFSYFDLLLWDLAHLESGIRCAHYSSNVSTIRRKFSWCFGHLCWGLVSIQTTDSHNITGNKQHGKQHGIFVEVFGHGEKGMCVFVQSEELHELKLLGFMFYVNLQIHFQQHMLAIHWQDTSDLLEVSFRERMKLNYFYNIDVIILSQQYI